MKRRTVIGLGSVALLSAGGFAWYELTSCSTPASIDVRTHYTENNVFTEGSEESEIGTLPGDPVHRLVTSEERASEIIRSDTEAKDFVSSIDFTESSLVIVFVGGSSTPDLHVRCVKREGDSIVIDVAFTKQAGSADTDTHRLFVVIHDSRNQRPDSITIDGPT